MVTLDGALFERSGTMSGGGGKPRGGKMGTSIRATSVSGEAVVIAEKELEAMVCSLNNLRQKITDAVRRYQASENAVARLEMDLAKSQKEVSVSTACLSMCMSELSFGLTSFLLKQIDSLNSQHGYLEKQIGSLEGASQPKKDELDKLEELKKNIAAEEKEIQKLIQGSQQLKDKVWNSFITSVLASSNSLMYSD